MVSLSAPLSVVWGFVLQGVFLLGVFLMSPTDISAVTLPRTRLPPVVINVLTPRPKVLRTPDLLPSCSHLKYVATTSVYPVTEN